MTKLRESCTNSQEREVERELHQFSREGIDTRAYHNSAIHAIKLKYPKPVKSDIVRHQIVAHMVEDYEFYYPKMEVYLDHHKLSYSAYIMYLYRGDIWADKFMLGALSRMFDIKTSVISPLYNDVWQVFHDSGIPHVVIISNGGDIYSLRSLFFLGSYFFLFCRLLFIAFLFSYTCTFWNRVWGKLFRWFT